MTAPFSQNSARSPVVFASATRSTCLCDEERPTDDTVDRKPDEPEPTSRESRALATELKFVVTPDGARTIRDWARLHLDADPHGAGPFGDEYRTTSLYFDNDALDVFNRRGSYGRAKYRVRRYGSSDVIFLERKMRTSALLAKRRTTVGVEDLGVLQESTRVPGWDGAWFHDRVSARRLQPLVQVSYQRMARQMKGAHGTVRLTVDDQLRALPALDYEFRDEAGMPVLSDRVIVELKYRIALPAIFRQLIETYALVPARLSKYRLAQDALQPRITLSPVRPATDLTPVYA